MRVGDKIQIIVYYGAEEPAAGVSVAKKMPTVMEGLCMHSKDKKSWLEQTCSHGWKEKKK